MALINCPECGNEISEKAKKCIHCGKSFEDIPTEIEEMICDECGKSFDKSNMECPHCGCPAPTKFDIKKIKFNKKTNIILSIVIGVVIVSCVGVAIYNSAPVKNYISEVEQDRAALESSDIAFKEAKEADKNNDYELALRKYKAVIQDDKSYQKAQGRIKELQDTYKNQLLSEAENYAQNKKYKEAIQNVDKVISTFGASEELSDLKQKYTDLKASQYAKIVVTDKTVTPKNTSNWVFNNYVNFVFEITNNSDKAIKGIEGMLNISDLFGKPILTIGCDFTGQTIEAGATITESELRFECNEFRDEHVKFFNTDFSDLQFSYDITNIVYTDGTTVVPE